MSLHVIPSWHVYSSEVYFAAAIGVRWWLLGVKVHPWGVRLMLVWWHLCWHWGAE